MLNNPLKYTDPSGEFFEWIFGLGNLLTRIDRGSIKNFGDGLEAFFQGFLVGAIVGPSMLTITSPFNTYGILSGLVQGDWKRVNNSARMFWGNFYLDENRTFLGGVWQGVSRFTWENPQTSIGNKYSQLMNAIKTIDRVDYLGGATFVTNENAQTNRGVSIGNFMNIEITGQINRLRTTKPFIYARIRALH